LGTWFSDFRGCKVKIGSATRNCDLHGIVAVVTIDVII